MKEYRVMQRGHRVGHTPLPYGEVVTYRKLGCRQKDLEPFIRRGVLKIVPKKTEPVPHNAEVTAEVLGE